MDSSILTASPPATDAVAPAAPRRRGGTGVTTWSPLVLLPAALLLWASAVKSIDLTAMNDYGLVSVLPIRVWVALILVIFSFALCWPRADKSGPMLALHIVLFIVLFYGIPAVISDSPRGPIVYRHAGIADYLTRARLVNSRLDAYFNWPGFFMGLGWTVDIGRMGNALVLARWAPLVVDLLYLPTLLMLLRVLTRNARLIWAAALIFFVTNWVNQDYLAPQSFTYLFYMVVLALVLRYLKPLEGAAPVPDFTLAARGPLRRRIDQGWHRLRRAVVGPNTALAGGPGGGVGGRTGVLVTVLVIVLFAATVASHQLTPFALFFAVSALVYTGHCRVKGLPVLMAVMLVAWTLFVASGYIDGHLAAITRASGVGSSAASNVAQRLAGSEQHIFIVRERVVLSACAWLLAVAGAIYRARARHRFRAPTLLALAPIPLFLLPYGGEVLLRLYFFMLPFVAFFAAALFAPEAVDSREATWRPQASATRRIFMVALLTCTVSVLMAGSFVARYGNERMDFYTAEERAAVQELYRLAPPGSYLLAEAGYLPWRYQDYEWNRADPQVGGHRYLSLTQEWELDPTRSPREMVAWTAATLAENHAAGHPAGFLILSRSQRAHEEILGGIDESKMNEYERMLSESRALRLVYSNREAKIYARIPGP